MMPGWNNFSVECPQTEIDFKNKFDYLKYSYLGLFYSLFIIYCFEIITFHVTVLKELQESRESTLG